MLYPSCPIVFPGLPILCRSFQPPPQVHLPIHVRLLHRLREGLSQILNTLIECLSVSMAIELVRDIAKHCGPHSLQTLRHRKVDPSRLVRENAALLAVRLEVCCVIGRGEDENRLERLHGEEGRDDGRRRHFGEFGEFLDSVRRALEGLKRVEIFTTSTRCRDYSDVVVRECGRGRVCSYGGLAQ